MAEHARFSLSLAGELGKLSDHFTEVQKIQRRSDSQPTPCDVDSYFPNSRNQLR